MVDTGTTAEATHPPGIIVEIMGIEKGDRGRSCEEHDVCGEVVGILCCASGGSKFWCMGKRRPASPAIG